MLKSDSLSCATQLQFPIDHLSEMLRHCVLFLSLVLLLPSALARNANSGEYPGQAAVYMPVNRFGEGVVLNRNHILTTASNVFDVTVGFRLAASQITVRVGTINIGANAPAVLAVIRVYHHEDYNRFSLENNVAVLRTQLDMNFTPESVIPFLFPAVLHNRIVAESWNCELVGWNAPPNNVNTVLQVIAMPVMARRLCNSALTNPLIQGRVTDQHMCVGVATNNPAICNNNPGAGFYCSGRLVGILSSGRQCNTANSPGLVIQLRYFSNWIERQFLRSDNPGPGPISPPAIN